MGIYNNRDDVMLLYIFLFQKLHKVSTRKSLKDVDIYQACNV